MTLQLHRLFFFPSRFFHFICSPNLPCKILATLHESSAKWACTRDRSHQNNPSPSRSTAMQPLVIRGSSECVVSNLRERSARMIVHRYSEWSLPWNCELDSCFGLYSPHTRYGYHVFGFIFSHVAVMIILTQSVFHCSPLPYMCMFSDFQYMSTEPYHSALMIPYVSAVCRRCIDSSLRWTSVLSISLITD